MPQPPQLNNANQSFSERLEGLPGNVRGALWILISAVMFTGMGTLVKLLSGAFDSFQIAFFRALFGLLAIMPFIFRMGLSQLRTKRMPLHIARGVIGASGMLCGFYALTHLTYADAVAFSYARGLFVIPLAVLFLGEVVRRRRWTATAVGFIGVLVMLRPGGDFDLAMAVALLGAFFVAFVTIIIKKLVTTERPETLIFYFGIISSSIALIPALYVWRAPTLSQIGVLMAVGACGAAGQYCMVRGYRVGEATAIIPFDYSRLLFATLVGIWLFTEVPDVWTLSGAAIIVAATLYIALREAQAKS